jgi:hypothetical protein
MCLTLACLHGFHRRPDPSCEYHVHSTIRLESRMWRLCDRDGLSWQTRRQGSEVPEANEVVRRSAVDVASVQSADCCGNTYEASLPPFGFRGTGN